jgi:hypothetical protein
MPLAASAASRPACLASSAIWEGLFASSAMAFFLW